MGKVTDEFYECWRIAAQFIESQSEELRWLRGHLSPPFIEHLSFCLGNQIFFLQIFDVDEVLQTPNSNLNGLISFAKECNAISCLLPMKKIEKNWQPQGKEWCLINAETMEDINPKNLITEQEIEMSDWEIQDMAVTLVKDKLENEGKSIMSWQSNPGVYPSIWFEDEIGPQYVIVSAVRYPVKEGKLPKNIEEIKREHKKLSSMGHFTSVMLVNTNDPFDFLAKKNGNFLPLIRGVGMVPKIGELQPLEVHS